MNMNERIRKLRENSLNAVNRISAERALLLTEFYQSGIAPGESLPVCRAMAFRYILENKEICILPDELIVGERGPEPKSTPTYPEICLHSLEDLKILNNRKKVSYKVDEETRKAYEEVIIPYWTGKSNRERIMESMDQAWLDAYSAGIFTEFQEQRAPGHTVAGDKIYKKGMLDIKNDIREALNNLDFKNDPEAPVKKEELQGMDIAADTLNMFAQRHAEKLELLAEKGYQIINIDAVIHLEKPKLVEFKKSIRENLAKIIGIKLECINIKAKTREKLDAVGKNEAIEIIATTLLKKT